MSWTVQTIGSTQIQYGVKVRVKFSASGAMLFEDPANSITEKTDLLVTESERSITMLTTTVIGTMKQSASVSELSEQVKAALDKWSTWNIVIQSVETYSWTPGEVTTQQAVALGAAAVIAVICVAGYLYFKGGRI